MEPVKDATLSAAQIQVRHCRTIAEYEACLRLERITWGEGILVPTAIFVVAQETGGQILGAYAGDELVGFTLALAGIHDGRPFLHSHMTAVLEAYRDRGVGRSLKLFQRHDAISRGIQLIEWTFDPLELKNAHFNLMRLGAISRRFIPNCYGVTESPLHARMPTDRLLAEWWLDSPRVNALIARSAGDAPPEPAASASPRIPADAVKIGIPANIGEIRYANRVGAEGVQSGMREQFENWFAKGYVATSLVTTGPVAEYVLQPSAAVAADIFPANQF